MVPGIHFPVNEINLAICYGNLPTMSKNSLLDYTIT